MKIKKLFKIFPSAEKIKIIDILNLDEIYFGNMGYLPSELLELPIESARSTIDLKTNRPMLNIYVMRVTANDFSRRRSWRTPSYNLPS